jgi:hypothetical protein
MTNYSFAGPRKGITDPEEVQTYEILEDDVYAEEAIAVLRWLGDDYNPDNAWIQYTEQDVVDPTQCR